MKALLASVCVLMVAACGPGGRTSGTSPSAPAGAPSSWSAPSSTAYPAAKVLRDPGGTLAVNVGDEFDIQLTPAAGFNPWSPITSSADSVAQLYPPAPTGTAFTAMAPGRALLTASTTPICRPSAPLPSGEGYACPALARAWQLEVTVVAHPRPAVSVLTTADQPGSTFHLLVGDILTLGGRAGTSPSGITLTAVQIEPAGILGDVRRNADGTQSVTAVAAGTTRITASTDAPCFHTVPACEIPTMLVRLQVVVGTASGG